MSYLRNKLTQFCFTFCLFESLGFHLSASVVSSSGFISDDDSQHNSDKDDDSSDEDVVKTYNVAITFDRRRITSCNCTCTSRDLWCSHVVAVCLQRIHQVTCCNFCYVFFKHFNRLSFVLFNTSCRLFCNPEYIAT